MWALGNLDSQTREMEELLQFGVIHNIPSIFSICLRKGAHIQAEINHLTRG